MKKIIINVKLLIVFICAFLISCGSAEKKLDNALLWKISGNGLESPSYILGTHHMLNISYLDSISGLRDALDRSSQFIGEILTDSLSLAELNGLIIQRAEFSEEQSYRKLLTEDEYDIFCKDLFKVFGGKSNYLGRLRPAIISMEFSRYIYSQIDSTYNWREHKPMDIYLQEVAKNTKKPVLGLETGQERVDVLFNSKEEKVQAKDLLCALGNLEESQKIVEDINAYYKERSLSKLYQIFHADKKNDCSPAARMLSGVEKERHEKWMRSISEEIKKHPSFIAVGAYHLLGKCGLLAELHKSGYIIESVH